MKLHIKELIKESITPYYVDKEMSLNSVDF